MKIWWTNQADCEAIGDDLLKEMPVYLRDQYRNRYGRNGRGRLWSDSQFGDVSVSPWPDTPLARVFGESFLGQTYAGIVIRDEDVGLLAELPGVITDIQLRRA